MNFEELKSRDIKDLRVLAAQYGIKTHHRAKPETVAKLIVEHITAKPHGQDLKHKAEKPQPTIMAVMTEEGVRELLPNLFSKEGFRAVFPGDDTVIFSYKGAEESIHLSTPPRWIKIKAENVSRGARKPAMINLGDGLIMGVG